jgi:hypothetical protein
MPEDQWFPRAREECDPRFWTILQESFYASYTHRGSQLSQHCMLQFTALRAAAAGEAILPFFDYQRGLVDIVTRRSRYVPNWVRVFYATVYVDADRVAIRFMFMGQHQRLTREGIAELLQVDLHDDSIHYPPTSSLLVVHTHQFYPPTRRSPFCPSHRSSPVHTGHLTV